MIFCTDADLLVWEPDVFADTAFLSQQLLAGAADLAGNVLTVPGGTLLDARIAARQVINLSGVINGSYPIVSVDSANRLTLSPLFEGLDAQPGQLCPAGSATGLSFTIRTFYPQRRLVSEQLAAAASVGLEVADAAAIVNVADLRRPCVLGTLQVIYNARAAGALEPAAFTVRAEFYERQYRRAIAQTRVQFDLNGDGKADLARPLNVMQLVRT